MALPRRKKQRFYLGQPFWLYRREPDQWFYTLHENQEGVGAFPSEGDAFAKALLMIGELEAARRRRGTPPG